MLRAMCIVFLFLLAACSSAPVSTIDDSPPKDLIPHAKMVTVMVDVHLLEAGITIHDGNAATTGKPKEPIPFYDVMKKNGVTKDQYDRSFRYYSLHLDEMNRLYDEVLSELTRIQTREAQKK